jgi:hypothetical protein
MMVSRVKPKQEYRPPKLHVYGDLTQMTKSKSSGTKSDTGGPHLKTS